MSLVGVGAGVGADALTGSVMMDFSVVLDI
jgi:hypothetical protein